MTTVTLRVATRGKRPGDRIEVSPEIADKLVSHRQAVLAEDSQPLTEGEHEPGGQGTAYDDLTKVELQLPTTGTKDELLQRLVEADTAS